MSFRVGIAGSGYIARGLVLLLEDLPDLRVSRVLTRSEVNRRVDFPRPDLLTNNLAEVVQTSDVVVECSGDVLHATDVAEAVLAAGLPLVTMDAEMQVTTGSYFAGRGVFTEAEGDQPGCLAALHEDAVQMGFRPLVYGNVKGYLNHNPTREDMEYWAARQGIALDKVIAFTDGTKVQCEQALVANGLGAGIARDGLLAPSVEGLTPAAELLASAAEQLGYPVADFVVAPSSPPGVFLVVTHADEQRPFLKYYKLGNGPHYLLLRNYHLCHLEVPKTLRRVLSGGPPLLHNSEHPSIGLAAVAKTDLEPGHRIDRGIGGWDVRGIAVRIAENADYAPIGLMSGATITRSVREGEMLLQSSVEFPPSPAHDAWREVHQRVVGRRGAGTILLE